MHRYPFGLIVALTILLPSTLKAQSSGLMLDMDPQFRFQFAGVVGERIAANNSGWLTRAPAADPGLLAMFALRDRQPTPNLMPWAGEFVGKYLMSAIQAIRFDNDPKLAATVKSVIEELIQSQAEDGYLGPFPQEERLLKHWDLWGHYHVMLALLMWHEQTGDGAALQACRKAADLVCATYLDTGRRPREAGSTEMNLAIIHALGRLYRTTPEDRYLQMMRVIEQDWEQEGDYLRTGLAGVEFYRTPKPRWESLPDLQGLLELFLITGDVRYRTAFLHHWNSIRRLDRRNTGGFSSGEQATGTPYESTAIETCCTIAWMALTVDALRLSGNPIAADELELSTFNGMLGAQHPSGSWWTYNTPMNGVREASHHTIVFQSRPGTPDLNCCSVNAPRGLGMLSEWAIMRASDGFAVNYYGPLQARLTLPDGVTVALRQDTRYPLDGTVKIQIQTKEPHEFALRLRIPAWSAKTAVQVVSAQRAAGRKDSRAEEASDQRASGGVSTSPEPGSYLVLNRRWTSGDTVELQFDMPLRYEPGGGEMAGRMSVYRGPLLLAYDVLLNDNAPPDPVPCTPSDLQQARVSFPASAPDQARIGRFSPWLIVDVPRGDGTVLRLCDFASAGARGSHYVSWLPAEQIAPPAPLPDSPEAGAAVPPGRQLFRARYGAALSNETRLRLLIADNPDLHEPIVDMLCQQPRSIVVPEEQAQHLQPNVDYYWGLSAENQWGATSSPVAPRQFTIDPSLAPWQDDMLTEYGENAEGVIVQAALQGNPEPSYGSLVSAAGWRSAPGPDGAPEQAVELNGADGLLVYQLRAFPQSEYTVAIRFSAQRVTGPLGQVFSAWCRSMDDPLRICVFDGKLYARIEAGGGYSTSGVPIEQNTWYDVCVVKRGNDLTLFLDGKPVETIRVPAAIASAARDFALGGNPHFTGLSEQLPCCVANLELITRPLTQEEVAARTRAGGE
ncbi:MAG: beta-L-arabinofuranosidase domain-containing protein [Pirellulaceae bacterium]